MVSIHVQYQVRHYWNKRDKILSGGRLPRPIRYLIRQDTFTRWAGKTTFDLTSFHCQNVEPHTCACAQRAKHHIPVGPHRTCNVKRLLCLRAHKVQYEALIRMEIQLIEFLYDQYIFLPLTGRGRS